MHIFQHCCRNFPQASLSLSILISHILFSPPLVSCYVSHPSFLSFLSLPALLFHSSFASGPRILQVTTIIDRNKMKNGSMTLCVCVHVSISLLSVHFRLSQSAGVSKTGSSCPSPTNVGFLIVYPARMTETRNSYLRLGKKNKNHHPDPNFPFPRERAGGSRHRIWESGEGLSHGGVGDGPGSHWLCCGYLFMDVFGK